MPLCIEQYSLLVSNLPAYGNSIRSWLANSGILTRLGISADFTPSAESLQKFAQMVNTDQLGTFSDRLSEFPRGVFVNSDDSKPCTFALLCFLHWKRSARDSL